MPGKKNYNDTTTISRVIGIIQEIMPEAGIGDYETHAPSSDGNYISVVLTNGRILVTREAIENVDDGYKITNYADYMVSTFIPNPPEIKKPVRKSLFKRVLDFALGLLSGIALTVSYQNGQLNVNGNDNVVNYYYNVINNDTTLVWQTQDVQSSDAVGRKIDFVIAILTQEKRWEIRSSDFLEKHLLFDKFFPGYLKSLPMLDSCSELIAVGVASQEGTKEDEFVRADKRADKILEILRPNSRGINLYKLNLGKYASINTGKETSGQRRVIIGGIKSRDPAMTIDDIRYALFEGLKKQMKNKLGINLSEYSEFYFTNPN